MSKVLWAFALCVYMLSFGVTAFAENAKVAVSKVVWTKPTAEHPGLMLQLQDAVNGGRPSLGAIATSGAVQNPALVVSLKDRLACNSATCKFLNTRGEIEFHSAEGLPKTKPTKAVIKSWSSQATACPSDWFAMYMERLGYPHRKDCDKPRVKSLFEVSEGIDTGVGRGRTSASQVQ